MIDLAESSYYVRLDHPNYAGRWNGGNEGGWPNDGWDNKWSVNNS